MYATTGEVDRGAAVAALLRGGADAAAKDEVGQTALMYAAANGHAGAIAALLAGGADAEAASVADSFKRHFLQLGTRGPLHCAHSYGPRMPGSLLPC